METLPQLPQDIIVNILSRLPVKSLLQFKCVSKPWRSLISDPHFAKLQLTQSQRNGNFSSQRVLLITEPPESAACEASGDDDDSKLILKLEYPTAMKRTPDSDELMDGQVDLGGSCNGLVCLVFENDRVFLLNPTIRETKELAKLNAFDRMGTFSYGFGFDFSTNDYKVVRAARPSSEDDASSETEVEILELKSNIWRRIEGFKSGIEIEGPGIFLHGALHWLGEKESDGLEIVNVIVSFQLAEEKFQLMPLPDQIEESNDSRVLGVSGDCLCLFNGCGERYFEAWLLKDSNKSSWTRLFGVQRDLVPRHRYWEKALCYTKSGKVVIDYGGRCLVWYDPKEKTSKTYTSRSNWGWFDPAIYIESLISPNCYDA
ncbi:F-box family protein, putative [Theobroma cacao]|uniref:F-box family protein, putative n=1 Tax=Theobroma cacao TaxID=3641 RepID=S1RTT0_THECC|nr:F-box family protein, putative [Theobroma cacao]